MYIVKLKLFFSIVEEKNLEDTEPPLPSCGCCFVMLCSTAWEVPPAIGQDRVFAPLTPGVIIESLR